MKSLKPSYKFYILFSLVFVIPATWIADQIEHYVKSLPLDSFPGHLASIGVFDAPTTVVVLFLIFWLFNNYIWKIKYLDILIGIPNINGRYEGELVSSHTEDKTQNGTYPVVIEVRQTLTDVEVFLYTERSCSYSLIANICKNYHYNNELVYVYQNKTSAMNKNSDMRDHHGSAFLEVSDAGNLLNGYYFNNPRERGRFGKIKVKRVGAKLKGSF